MNEQPKVAVIIPFYQKERGILKKAVLSVLAQKGYDNYEIIVVDDGSPVPAREELSDLLAKWPRKLRIIEQGNAGPGAARNRGLRSVSAGTRYVAFLDSDDQWTDMHLESAIHALELGYDFYFAPVKHFSWNSDFGSRVQIARQKIIDSDRRLFQVTTDLFDIVMRPNVVVTSTVVYKFECYSELRFHEDFFGGEDLLFWLDLFVCKPAVVFTDTIGAEYGRGVNIWTGSGWGSERMFDRSQDNLKFIKYVLNNYSLNPALRMHLTSQLGTARFNFVASVLHQFRLGRAIKMRILVRQLQIDAKTFLYFVPNAISVIKIKLAQRKSGREKGNDRL